MKNFIYLDTGFLESFSAQQNGGLTMQEQIETENKNQLQKGNKSVTSTTEVSGEVDFAIAKGEGKEIIQVQNAPSCVAATETSKNIIIKKQSDDIFNTFEAYLDSEDSNCDLTNIEVGKYLNFHGKLNFISFSRIEKIFNNNFESILRDYPVELAKLDKEEIKGIIDTLHFLKTMIPYDTFVCGKNIIAPLNEAFLRENKEQIGFKFEDNAQFLGRVNKVTQESNSQKPQLIEKLNIMQNIAFSMLKNFGFTYSKKLYIVTPIAIYC